MINEITHPNEFAYAKMATNENIFDMPMIDYASLAEALVRANKQITELKAENALLKTELVEAKAAAKLYQNELSTYLDRKF